MHLPLLSLVTFLPLLGALVLLLMRGAPQGVSDTAPGSGPDSAQDTPRWIALWTSLVVWALSVVLWISYDPTVAGFQFQQRADWMPALGISFHLGLDGISLLFVLLATTLTPIAILASWRLIDTRVRDYMLAILLLETTLIGVFAPLAFVVFYVFYEATLLPPSLLIGIWGGSRRVFASLKFFLFTFGGSLFMLIALIAMWQIAGTTDIPTLLATHFTPHAQGWMFLCFLLAFGVKLPVFPLHGWLPDAYAEAPAPATALIAGVLSKAGAYGFLRFAISMLPDASHRAAPWMIALGIIAVIYAAAVALAQTDMKRMIAYSSFSHMGLVLVGLFTLNAPGVAGAVFQMLSHGIIIAGLFFAVAMLSSRVGTGEIAGFGGVAHRMPKLATLAMLFAMANIGLPGTGAFVGELLVMIGAIQVGFWVALLSGMSMILGAVYMLVLYRRVMFGAVRGVLGTLRDLTAPELAVLAPLALITLWMGIYPSSFTRVFDPGVRVLAQMEHDSQAGPQQARIPGVLSVATRGP